VRRPPCHVACRNHLALFGLALRAGLGFDTLERIVPELAQIRRHQPAAPSQPCLPNLRQRESGLCRLQRAAIFCEVLQRGAAHRQEAGFHGQVSFQVTQPADPDLAQIQWNVQAHVAPAADDR